MTKLSKPWATDPKRAKTLTDRDKRLLSMISFSGAITTKQVGTYLEISPRYTRTLLSRLEKAEALSCCASATSAAGGRPTKVWAHPESPPENPNAALLLTEYLVTNLHSLPLESDLAEKVLEASFERNLIPAECPVLVYPTEPIEIVIPIESVRIADHFSRYVNDHLEPTGLDFVFITPAHIVDDVETILFKTAPLDDPFLTTKNSLRQWQEMMAALSDEQLKYRNLITHAISEKSAEEQAFSLIPYVMPKPNRFGRVETVSLYRVRQEP